MVLGVSQIVSSLFLGGIAIMYSRKVTLIESQRRDLEIKKEKVDFMKMLTEFQVEITTHAITLGETILIKKPHTRIAVREFDNLSKKYEAIKSFNGNTDDSQRELHAKEAFRNIYTIEFNSIEEDDANVVAAINKDEEIFLKTIYLAQMFEIRNDTGNHLDRIKSIKKLNEELANIHRQKLHPLVYALENKTHLLKLALNIECLRHELSIS